jgi:3-dehydrotetronate 4-kinase
MSTRLGCIADDFTGATDLAGMLARSGAPVSLRIGVPDEPPSQTASFEVIALKSRTAPVEDAVDECRRALAWLKKAGADRFFWKYCSTFDSTAKGNIGPVAEALMADLGAVQTIYCPAFPENGRSIFMGNLFVGRQPLAESPMKDHPLTPMRDSSLMRLLEPQVSKAVGLVDRLTVAKGLQAIGQALDALKAEGVAHVVVDAVADEDLDLIAQACHSMPLLTGGSALAMPLPGLYEASSPGTINTMSTSKPRLDRAAIVLSGSCSAMTRKQVAHYGNRAPSYHLDPLTLSKEGLGAALAWLDAQADEAAPMLYASAEPGDVKSAQEALGIERAGALVEEALASLAVAAREKGVRRFVVAGGETSGAVTKALGVTRLDIGAEIAPGVPWTYCQSASVRIALSLKSGNFGSEAFFSHALDLLEAA